MFGLGAPELVIIALVLMALFGYKKLPDAARSIGRSMRIFKAETKGMREDNVAAKAEAQTFRGPLNPGQEATTREAPQAASVEPDPAKADPTDDKR